MNDEYYMQLAIEQAKLAGALGEVPIGAVVVYQPIDKGTRKALAEPRVIASAYNRREIDASPSAHAEFLALQEASKQLGVWRLTGCTVYVTLEPCVMCAGLMSQARVDRCVYGAADPKAGALGTLYAINQDNRLNHAFAVEKGVLEEECTALLKDFFAARRAQHKQDKVEKRDTEARETDVRVTDVRETDACVTDVCVTDVCEIAGETVACEMVDANVREITDEHDAQQGEDQ